MGLDRGPDTAHRMRTISTAYRLRRWTRGLVQLEANRTYVLRQEACQFNAEFTFLASEVQILHAQCSVHASTRELVLNISPHAATPILEQFKLIPALPQQQAYSVS